MSIMVSEKLPRQFKELLTVSDYDAQRDRQALVDFMGLVYLIKQSIKGTEILDSNSSGATVPEHIAVFTPAADGISCGDERISSEEARRDMFLSRVSGLAIIEHGNIPLKSNSVEDLNTTHIAAIAAFGGHVLVETTLYMKDEVTLLGHAYDIYPETVLQSTDWQNLTAE
jgi:hypothetical protein